LLTSTLNVPRVGDALISYMLGLPGNERVQSVNPVVGETNDGGLNDIRGRHVGEKEVFAAITGARGGPMEEGSVGAGAGTIAFGFKGGIGTSSRKLPPRFGGYTVGVLVQTNFGGILTINGAPVGIELGQYYLKGTTGESNPDGSCMMVVATDAALAMAGLARTGSAESNGSGDYVIAFSTTGLAAPRPVSNDAMSPLFLAAIEATEEAIYNSLFKATTTAGRGRIVEALPIAKTLEILREHKALGGN